MIAMTEKLSRSVMRRLWSIGCDEESYSDEAPANSGHRLSTRLKAALRLVSFPRPMTARSAGTSWPRHPSSDGGAWVQAAASASRHVAAPIVLTAARNETGSG